MEAPTNARSQRPKSRQSIAYLPSNDVVNSDKENGTVDISALQRPKDATLQSPKKKSRSKSLGPGGLEALKENAGNAVKVRTLFMLSGSWHTDGTRHPRPCQNRS